MGIESVLTDDVGFRGRLAVVPDSGDGTCHLAAALLGIINIALVDAHKVGKHVEVVDVVVAAINVRNTANLSATGAPHLRHIDIRQRGGADAHATDGVPNNTLAT